MAFKDYIDTQIEYIKKRADPVEGDPSAAHAAEDSLYIATLQHIAENGDRASASLAKRALKAVDIVFPRWYE